MTTVQFGRAFYIIYTREELENMGLVRNPNMYIGDGWRFCVTCKQYSHVDAMSHKGQSDCFEVCLTCNTHTAKRPIADPSYTEYVKNFPLSDPRD